MNNDHAVHPGSYRDPAGFVFRSGNVYYRQVNRVYAQHYEQLFQSDLYTALTAGGWLIPHTEVPDNCRGDLTGGPWAEVYKILLPRQLPFISYPSEWSPGQLKDAALLTLRIMRTAMDHGMILKDASPMNIQFADGRPLFIDTLSFEKYAPSLPWVAYRQFCENFLFPLYLHHYLSTGTGVLLNAWPEGISAEITARLLPARSRLRLGVWLHVLLQSKVQRRTTAETQENPNRTGRDRQPSFSRDKLKNLVRNLEEIVTGIQTRMDSSSAWNNYYVSTILSQEYLVAKERIFRDLIADLTFDSALDLGANDGHFSMILAEKKALVIAADADWQCIERLYFNTGQKGITNILPLCVDLANPTAATGFDNKERSSFSSRASSGLVAALALVHHLAIGRNIPLDKIASSFAALTKVYLVIEFVPVEDPKVRELLRYREHFHKEYDVPSFEGHFTKYFAIEKKMTVPGTERILYLMKKMP